LTEDGAVEQGGGSGFLAPTGLTETGLGRLWLPAVLLLALLIQFAYKMRGADVIELGEYASPVAMTSEGSAPLAEIASGRCHYIILANPSCGACVGARDLWKRDAQLAPELAPPTWELTWVVAGDRHTAEAFYGHGVPAALAWQADPNFFEATGLIAFPSYLVLDRTGILIDRGVGARLPITTAFNHDCTIDARSSAPSNR